jgi:hypothetical protein
MLTVLQSQAVEITPTMLSLFANIVKLMSQGNFEHIKVVMRIIEEYLVLGKAEFLRVNCWDFLNCISCT